MKGYLFLTLDDGTPLDFGAPYGPAEDEWLSELVPSPAPFERALADAMSDYLPVPIAEIMDPYRTPVRFLPFLAAHYSVDLWFDDWPEARRREMVAQCAGRSVLYPGRLADLKGTREGLRRYLSFVDAELVSVIAHPTRYVIGRSAIGSTPVAHPPMTAHYLVRVALERPANTLVIGRSAIGRTALRDVDREPIRRAQLAATISKASETLYTMSFAWRRRLTLNDAIPIDGSTAIGDWTSRTSLQEAA